jgi:hypothetical protein
MLEWVPPVITALAVRDESETEKSSFAAIDPISGVE